MNKAQRTRQYIIEKAAPIFNQRGYAGTSIAELSDRIQMTKGAIYGNFAGKDELALEAFAYNVAQLSVALKTAVEQENNAVDRLLAYPRYYRQTASMIFEWGGCPILNAAVDADDTHEALREQVNLAISRWTSDLIRIMEEGQQAGSIRADADAPQYAEVILSLTEGGLLLAKTTGQLSFLYRALDQVEYMIRYELGM